MIIDYMNYLNTVGASHCDSLIRKTLARQTKEPLVKNLEMSTIIGRRSRRRLKTNTESVLLSIYENAEPK